ncbi:MAG: hypothetical protein AAF202_12155, partial [Pseudomonadota bacterium]
MIFGSSMPQLLWNVTDQSYYHISRETDRVERQVIANSLGVTAVFPYQFGKVWYTIANAQVKAGRDFYTLEHFSEIDGAECMFMRGDVGSQGTKSQKSILYENFPELEERPKMTAHQHLQHVMGKKDHAIRSDYLMKTWTDGQIAKAPRCLKTRHYYRLLRPNKKAWLSGYFWDIFPTVKI